MLLNCKESKLVNSVRSLQFAIHSRGHLLQEILNAACGLLIADCRLVTEDCRLTVVIQKSVVSPHSNSYMKFIVSSSSLLKQLQHIAGVINANTVLPILEDFLFEVEKNKLTVVATDLETVMRVQLDIEAKDSGKVCIPAKILIDSLKNLADQPLTFNIDKNFAINKTPGFILGIEIK